MNTWESFQILGLGNQRKTKYGKVLGLLCFNYCGSFYVKVDSLPDLYGQCKLLVLRSLAFLFFAKDLW